MVTVQVNRKKMPMCTLYGGEYIVHNIGTSTCNIVSVFGMARKRICARTCNYCLHVGMPRNHTRTCNLQHHSSSYLYNVPAEISSGGSHVNNRLPFLTRLKLAFLGGLRAVDEILTCSKKQKKCVAQMAAPPQQQKHRQTSVVHAPKHHTTVKPPNQHILPFSCHVRQTPRVFDFQPGPRPARPLRIPPLCPQTKTGPDQW
jgi:hypothetical protein